MLYDNDIFEHEGRRFRVTFPADDFGDSPWENEDGHGPVSDLVQRAKRPGEIILDGYRCYEGDNRPVRFYDFAEAMKIAKRDGWDAEPCKTGTRGETALRAVRDDFKRLKAFCASEWYYIGVVVELLEGEDDEPSGITESLWGIESDADDYREETARELADQII